MKSLRLALLAVAVAVAVATGSSESSASCNVIPTSPPSPSPPDHDGGFNAAGGLEFPFKGGLGRIDRVYLVPGHTKRFAVEADGICVSNSTQVAVEPFRDLSEVVAVVLFMRDGKPLASVYGKGTHDVLKAAGTSAAFDLLDDYTAASIELVATAKNEVVLPVPTLAQAAAVTAAIAANGAADTRTDLRIVVGRRPAAAADLVSMFNAAATGDCSSHCTEFARSGGVVCVDRIYALEKDATGAGKYVPDDVPCHVNAPLNPPKNDFARQCEEADSGDLPACQGDADKLEYWKDGCGGVHYAFDWKEIRGGPDVKRIVMGRTGAGRKAAAANPKVVIPGREFVGSTPVDDAQGDDEGVDWRLPRIELWQSDESQEEVGLLGVVDRDDSIVHIYPRLRTAALCDTAKREACFGIGERNPDGTPTTCACRDRHQATCECEDYDKNSPRYYFACEGGEFAGRPCTRSNHCNGESGEAGTCTAQPRCLAPGTVWGDSAQPGVVCSTDQDCTDREIEKTQCGYLLFDFKARVPPLDAFVSGNSKDERGTCKPGGEACSKSGGGNKPPRCSSTSKKCRGYVLEAGGVVPPD